MIRTLLSALTLGLCTVLAAGEPPVDAEGHAWWQHAVFYEVYPRSFQDTNGDGLGDLNGVTSRLDYLQDLGVDAIWLTPCFPSPQVDFGYDVADYRAIDPQFGTLPDFDRLVAEGRRRQIRVLLDLVLNHTSDQHPWFKDARSSRQAPKRDWYVWRDGKGPGLPPCNWQALFGGPAWTLDPATGQYYYHFFYRQQPDLNWRNPQVHDEMLDITRWWYQRGVAGFRLDAMDNVFEDPGLTDNPVLPGRNPLGDPNMANVHNYKLPEGHGLLRDLRVAADASGAVLIGETYTDSTEELKAYYGNGHDELQMPMGHMLAMAGTLDAAEFRRRIDATAATGFWPVWVLDNHDLARSATRFGDGLHDDAIAKVLGTLLLTLRGTPILYYGEELGMVNNDPRRREDVRDPLALLGWPRAKKRDGERTPMQWDATPKAGFTTGRPWLAIPPSAATRNVETELKDPGSVLVFHRELIALRREQPALREGDYHALNTDNPKVLSYLRTYRDQAVLVVVNLSAEKRSTAFDLAALGWDGSRSKVLLGSGSRLPEAGLPGEVGPFGVVVAEVPRARP